MSIVTRGLGSSSLVTSGYAASTGEWTGFVVAGAEAQGSAGSTRLLAVVPVASAEAQGAANPTLISVRVVVSGAEALGTTGSTLRTASVPVTSAEAHGTTGSARLTVTVAVTGAEAHGATGSVRPSATVPVSIAEAQGEAGSASLAAWVSVSGAEALGSVNSVELVTIGVSLPVTGAEATGAANSVSLAANIPVTSAEAIGTGSTTFGKQTEATLWVSGAESRSVPGSARLVGVVPVPGALGRSTITSARLLARIPVSSASGDGVVGSCLLSTVAPRPRPTPYTPTLPVTKLVVRSFDLDHLDVFWEIGTVLGSRDDGDHDVLQFEFYVLRSEQAMGPYELVGGPFRDLYHFRDTSVSLLHKWRQYYYKLRVVHRFSGAATEFGPAASHEPEPDLLAVEMMRQEDVLFREFIGRKCWLLPARTFGPRCSCFDPILQRKTRAEHLACFRTGWFGGYLSPVEIYVQIDPNPKQTQIQTLDEGQISVTSARTSPFPPISPRDILVESKNRRWRVINVTPTQRLRATVHQELSLYEIPRGDIEYEIPLNVDVGTVVPASERNFMNSQNVDPNDLSDILSFWSGKPRGSLR